MIVSHSIFWNFASLIFSLSSLVLCLRVVWRVEKKLDIYFKILAVVYVVASIHAIAAVLIQIKLLTISSLVFDIMDSVLMLIVLFSLIVMNSLVKDIDNER
jgi:hypothetical protein